MKWRKAQKKKAKAQEAPVAKAQEPSVAKAQEPSVAKAQELPVAEPSPAGQDPEPAREPAATWVAVGAPGGMPSEPDAMSRPDTAPRIEDAGEAGASPGDAGGSPVATATAAEAPDTADVAEIVEAMYRAALTRTEILDRRDRAAAERDAIANDRDRAAAERDAIANDRDRAAAERERATAERAVTSTAGPVAGPDAAVGTGDEAALERARLEALLQRAHLDPLTGAFRREMGRLALRNEIDRARRGDGSFVLAFLDVDGLKAVNDEQGHAAGDHVLRTLVAIMRANLRSYDPIVRFGGDEFVCGIASIDADEVRHRISVMDQSLRHATGAGITAGMASITSNESLEELISRADAALLEAKRSRGEDAPPPEG